MSRVFGRNSPRKSRTVTLVIDRGGHQRQLRIDSRLSLVIGVLLLVLGIWYLAATIYLVFRDDVLVSLTTRQAQVQESYEDTISSLQATIERVTSRQLVERDTIEGRMKDISARQAQLEARHALLTSLALQVEGIGKASVTGGSRSPGDIAGTVPARVAPSLPSAPPMPVAAPSVTVMPRSPLPAGLNAFAPVEKPHPLSEFGPLRGSGEARRTSDPEPPPATGPRTSQLLSPDVPVETRLDRLGSSLAEVESQQIGQLRVFESKARLASLRLGSLFSELGLDRSRFAGVPPAAQGGPLVPVDIDPTRGPFESGVDTLQRQLAEADRLRRLAATLPLARPLAGEIETTSGFGYRLDPFTRSIAMHTGLDFRDEWGAPVRATAPGKVVTAEWSGGYGRMVEIDHGNGISTRYGHLSQIGVEVGRQVQTGDVIGRLGSTGRSTGPHLHYETRVDGDAVDPLRYLRAAERLERE